MKLKKTKTRVGTRPLKFNETKMKLHIVLTNPNTGFFYEQKVCAKQTLHDLYCTLPGLDNDYITTE